MNTIPAYRYMRRVHVHEGVYMRRVHVHEGVAVAMVGEQTRRPEAEEYFCEDTSTENCL